MELIQEYKSSSAYAAIKLIQQTRGTNAKKAILGECKGLARYLLYAYNPYWQYGVSVPNNILPAGNEDMDDSTFEFLHSLQLRHITGGRAQNELRKHVQRLNYTSGSVLIGIIKKSFDLGIAAKGINEVFPGLIPCHAIMLAKPIDYTKVIYPCLTSPKLDGLRATFKDGQFYSRKGHVLQGLTILSKLVGTYLPGLPMLDGELMVPGQHFDEISGTIRSFKETPEVVYNIFDTQNEEQGMYERYDSLERAFSGSNIPPQLLLVPHAFAYRREDLDAAYYNYRRLGYEGVMVKSMHAPYVNTRSWNWMKIKNTSTVDLRVRGVFAGEGKYEGLCGGIIVVHGTTPVHVGSGLSDAQRVNWAADPDIIIGQMVEISYQEVTPSGSLRFPRLTKVRGDM